MKGRQASHSRLFRRIAADGAISEITRPYNDRGYAVLMASSDDPEDLAHGFSHARPDAMLVAR